MSVQELKSVIAQLPQDELADFAQWFEEFHADAWDRQIAEDVKQGRFKDVIRQAQEQVRSGHVKPL